MKAQIWAGLLHCMSSDDNPMHTRCSPTWCWYRRAEENGENPDSHRLHAGNSLSREVGQKLIPVYHRMSSDSLLTRMQHGGTQNANECLNSVIWARCPKTVFVGKTRVEAAASMAISIFNEAASFKCKHSQKSEKTPAGDRGGPYIWCWHGDVDCTFIWGNYVV